MALAEGNTLGKGPLLFHLPQVVPGHGLHACGQPLGTATAPATAGLCRCCWTSMALPMHHQRTLLNPSLCGHLHPRIAQSAVHSLVILPAAAGDPGAVELRLQLMRLAAVLVVESCESGGCWRVHGVTQGSSQNVGKQMVVWSCPVLRRQRHMRRMLGVLTAAALPALPTLGADVVEAMQLHLLLLATAK